MGNILVRNNFSKYKYIHLISYQRKNFLKITHVYYSVILIEHNCIEQIIEEIWGINKARISKQIFISMGCSTQIRIQIQVRESGEEAAILLPLVSISIVTHAVPL